MEVEPEATKPPEIKPSTSPTMRNREKKAVPIDFSAAC
jgi:hypothetical protein